MSTELVFIHDETEEVLFSVEVPDSTIDILQGMADSKGVTLEEEVRAAIRYGIDNLNKETEYPLKDVLD